MKPRARARVCACCLFRATAPPSLSRVRTLVMRAAPRAQAPVHLPCSPCLLARPAAARRWALAGQHPTVPGNRLDEYHLLGSQPPLRKRRRGRPSKAAVGNSVGATPLASNRRAHTRAPCASGCPTTPSRTPCSLVQAPRNNYSASREPTTLVLARKRRAQMVRARVSAPLPPASS